VSHKLPAAHARFMVLRSYGAGLARLLQMTALLE
jgi:hypothetical protein